MKEIKAREDQETGRSPGLLYSLEDQMKKKSCHLQDL